jgi:hypothetical protein
MELTRRNLLQGFTAASILGGLTLAGCTPSSGSASSAATAGTASASLTFNDKAWSYDATNDVYYQIGTSYVATPGATDYETLGIYVPGKYLSATKNSDGTTYTAKVNASGKVGDYTAASAPIVFPVNTPGYAAQKPPSAYSYDDVSDYLKAGLIYVAAGLRGKDSNTSAYTGNAPWGVTDLKAAVRYIRYNASVLPGNKDRIAVFGMSGGGAQSAVMGASGDSPLYTPYLSSIGAAMKDADGRAISDAVAGAMCWCPITSLDYANAAYEWNMGQFATSGTRAAGTWTAAYSKNLAEAFATYINKLGLKDSGTALTLEKSSKGTYLSGSYYDYVLRAINTSLNNFLSDTTFPYTPSSQTMAGMGGPGGGTGGPPSGAGAPSGAAGMPSGAGPSAQATSTASATTYRTIAEYIDHLNSDGSWVNYDAGSKTATVLSLEGFVKSQKNASKDVGAFDGVSRNQGENVVLGLNTAGLHFAQVSKDVIAANESSYKALSGWDAADAASEYSSDFGKVDSIGTAVASRQDMYNPMYYASSFYDGYQKSTVAPHWRIRTGIMQGDTANTVELNLALALQTMGKDVDFATVWGLPHTMAERTGERPRTSSPGSRTRSPRASRHAFTNDACHPSLVEATGCTTSLCRRNHGVQGGLKRANLGCPTVSSPACDAAWRSSESCSE